jgi:hypothetical protein
MTIGFESKPFAKEEEEKVIFPFLFFRQSARASQSKRAREKARPVKLVFSLFSSLPPSGEHLTGLLHRTAWLVKGREKRERDR